MSSTDSVSSGDTGTWKFSAPGKTILFGEHSVVYGKTAIAGSIGLRTFAELKIRPQSGNILDEQIEINLPDLNFCRSFSRRKLYEAANKLEKICREENEPEELPPPPDLAVPLATEIIGPLATNENNSTPSKSAKSTPMNLAMITFVYVLLGAMTRNRDIPAFKLTISSKVPIRIGLGSSGAYCVTLCTALLRLANVIGWPSISQKDGMTWLEEDLCTIERWGKSAESLIHGKTSGLDVAVCTRGGLLSYRTGELPEPITCAADLRVIIVNTKVERNTLHMISVVKQKLEKASVEVENNFPEVIKKIFDSIDEITREATKILASLPAKSGSSSPAPSVRKVNGLNGHLNGDTDSGNELNVLTNGFDTLRVDGSNNEYESLQELCRINNHLLNALGVGHAKILQICSLLARYGIHAKLSGAGGGGTAFAFVTKEASQTLLLMIEKELRQQGFELWQPDLGTAGILQHN
ncbi:GHMP kinase domain containing protein [Aphelenchoides bicaudatus]|nr:GHMP kinase domain containing protein [Aphelenchoides bicaudatus]